MKRLLALTLPVGLTLLALSPPAFSAEPLGASGAASMAQAASAPKARPTRTISNFSSALRCMDEIFLAHGIKDILITSAGMPDSTGKVATGTKDMMITAINTMTQQSRAFEFIDFHSGGGDLGLLFAARGDAQTKVPDLYIRGAITQMDDNVVRASRAGGISLSSDRSGDSFDPLSLALGYALTEAFDMLTMDMSVAETTSRKILTPTVTSNMLIMIKDSKGGEGGNTLGKIGLSFNVDKGRSEGLGAATRNLLELNLIETLGKLTQVPYWRCLDANISHPLIREQARLNYDLMNDSDRILFVQRKLGGSMNRYSGPLDGLASDEFKQALTDYQIKAGLLPDGRVSFDVYASLIDDAQNSLAALPPKPASAAIAAPPPPPPPSLQLSLESDKGRTPQHRVGEFFNLKVTLSGDGNAYCYYQDASRSTARVFPNRFQSSPWLRANSELRLPSRGFKIRFDRPGAEKVACIAAEKELVLPPALAPTADLAALPVASVDEVINQFMQHNPSASVGIIDIAVSP